jgi:2-oxoglutarate ferredoxin oxidoreductase subunit delta
MAKGRIVVNEEMCKGCELCTTVCPYDLIQMADHYNTKGYKPAVLVDPEQRCTGCTLCAMICPDAVITVFRAKYPRSARRVQGEVEAKSVAGSLPVSTALAMTL